MTEHSRINKIKYSQVWDSRSQAYVDWREFIIVDV